MRVMRRETLDLVQPLPDGLHFTPAMTCPAALDPRLPVVETQMGCAEREGRSKLSVLRDGLRRVLFADAVFMALPCLAVALAMNVRASAQHLDSGAIQVPWASVACGGLLALASLQLCASAFVQKMLRTLAQRVEMAPSGRARAGQNHSPGT